MEQIAQDYYIDEYCGELYAVTASSFGATGPMMEEIQQKYYDTDIRHIYLIIKTHTGNRRGQFLIGSDINTEHPTFKIIDDDLDKPFAHIAAKHFTDIQIKGIYQQGMRERIYRLREELYK